MWSNMLPIYVCVAHVQADTGTKMIHVGKNTRSRIVSKGISAGTSRNCYRGLVQVRLANGSWGVFATLRTDGTPSSDYI